MVTLPLNGVLKERHSFGENASVWMRALCRPFGTLHFWVWLLTAD